MQNRSCALSAGAQISVLAMAAAIVAISLSLSLAIGTQPALAQIPFGGPAVGPFVPPTVPPAGVCPGHIIVANLYPPGPKVIGLFIVPGSMIYPRFHVYSPFFQLGYYLSTPIETCPFPYPVFPIMIDGTN